MLVVEVEDNMRHGVLPGEGGWLDQDTGLMVLARIAKDLRAEREHTNNVKRNRRRSKDTRGR